VSALEQELRGAIDALADPGGRSRLLKALPSLLEGVESWGGPQKHEQDDVLVAAALPGNCVVFAANVWPVYDEEQAARPGDIARALCANLACATPTSEVAINILTALTVLLGPEALERQQREVQRIRSGGGVPLVITLLDRQDKDVTMMVTVVAVPRPTVH
jgi:hypothetical protein